MNWVEKYRPETFLEIKGQELAIEKLKKFLEEFTLGKLTKTAKRAAILHGPPGTGKTALAYVVAKSRNAEIFELNASDLRNRAKLEEILRPAIEQQSLIKKGKIILVDEVDGISAVDRGGLSELMTLIQLTPYPVIITANDVWGKKLAPLRKQSEIIQLKGVNYNVIKAVLFDILRKEGLFIDNKIVTEIAVKAKGDLRAAINDIQSVSKTDNISEIEFDERNKETDIFNALKTVFKGEPNKETLGVFNSVKMNMDEIILWIEENIPLEYEGEELAKAYEALSRTDIFKRRIYRQQYWRFLVYQNILLSYGISAAKKNPKTGFTSYKKPTRILKIWINNKRIAKKKSIEDKYAKYAHVGKKRALQEFPVLVEIFKKPEVQKELKLNEEEIAYLENKN